MGPWGPWGSRQGWVIRLPMDEINETATSLTSSTFCGNSSSDEAPAIWGLDLVVVMVADSYNAIVT